MRGDHTPERKPVPVEVGLVNGTTLRGKVWVTAGKSMADMLNAAQAFFEFTPFGETRTCHLAKAHILTLSPIELPTQVLLYERRGAGDANDPHEILGVAPGTAWHTVREAYLQLAKAYHPDRFAGVTLPDEVREYMGARARRINAAYALLEGSLRHAANGAGTGCAAGG